MNFNYLYKKLPGNRFEKGALKDILVFQFISIVLSAIFFICSIYFNKYFIYGISFLYPILETGIYAIPIVLQEPGAANRYSAPSNIFLLYVFLFIITLIFTIITFLINYKITLIILTICYLISIFRILKQVKKSTEFYNQGF